MYEIVPGCEDDKEEVLNQVEQEQLAVVLWGMVGKLPGQQSEVLRMRYKETMKLREIGAEFGFSTDWARQIEGKALRELRKPQRSGILREFWKNSWIYSGGLYGNGVGTFNRSWTSSTERTAIKMIEKGTGDRVITN